MRGYHRPQRGRYGPVAVDERHVAFGYQGLDGFLRRTFVSFPTAEVEPASDGIDGGSVVVRWRREVAPGTQTEVEWTVWGTDARPPGAVPPAVEAFPDAAGDERGGRRGGIRRAGPRDRPLIQSDNQLFDRLVARGLTDLRLLLNDGPDPGERYIAAGVPWFATLFGRDALITALEAMAVRPEPRRSRRSRSSPRTRPRSTTRSTTPSPARSRTSCGPARWPGPASCRSAPYYGSVDSTPLWLVLLGETFDWTGDRRARRSALAERPGGARLDRPTPATSTATGSWSTGGGRTRGLLNQGWKDSGDAIRDRDGAHRRAADRPGRGPGLRLRREAAARPAGPAARRRGAAPTGSRPTPALRERFDEAFWMADLGSYAMALDRDKRRPRTRRPRTRARRLWSGIVPTERAPRRRRPPARRRHARSGWGIRTYAAGQPGYNPLGYHTGTHLAPRQRAHRWPG